MLLGASCPAAAEFSAYQAKLEDAGWRAVAGEAACHLFHDIPLLATVVLSEDMDGRLSTTLLLQRPAGASQEAGVYRSAPAWKAPRRSRLGTIPLSRVSTTLGLAGGESRAVSAALEAGDRVDVQFRAVGSDTPRLAAVLSPVRFRAALAEQRRCLARLRGDAPALPHAGGQQPAAARSSGDAAGGEPARLTPIAMTGRPAAGGMSADSEDGPPQAMPVARNVSELPPAPESRVYFSHDDAGFDRDDFDRVRRLAARLRQAPFWSRVSVVGHADASGSARRNRSLALARAIEVRNRLIQEGVDPGRIQVSARGEDAPAADNSTEYGRARNRRVEIRAEL